VIADLQRPNARLSLKRQSFTPVCRYPNWPRLRLSSNRNVARLPWCL